MLGVSGSTNAAARVGGRTDGFCFIRCVLVGPSTRGNIFPLRIRYISSPYMLPLLLFPPLQVHSYVRYTVMCISNIPGFYKTFIVRACCSILLYPESFFYTVSGLAPSSESIFRCPAWRQFNTMHTRCVCEDGGRTRHILYQRDSFKTWSPCQATLTTLVTLFQRWQQMEKKVFYSLWWRCCSR